MSTIRLHLELALVGVCIILFILLNRSCEKVEDRNEYISGLADTLEVSRNKLGQQTATIKSLEFENDKYFTKIQTNDSTIKWLQNVVKDYKGKLLSATVGSTTTIVSGSSETIYVNDTDVVYIGDTVYVYPIYKSTFSNRWEQGFIQASKDSIHYDFKVSNKFELTLGEVRNKWFKPKEMEVSILNLNPNTVTNELRSFNIKQTPKRWGLGVGAGYGLGLSSMKFQPFIGITLNYSLILIK